MKITADFERRMDVKLILNSRGFNTKSGTSQIYDAIKDDDLKDIADIKGIDVSEVEEVTTQNAKILFGL